MLKKLLSFILKAILIFIINNYRLLICARHGLIKKNNNKSIFSATRETGRRVKFIG